jgi:hypothetical protein
MRRLLSTWLPFLLLLCLGLASLGSPAVRRSCRR